MCVRKVTPLTPVPQLPPTPPLASLLPPHLASHPTNPLLRCLRSQLWLADPSELVTLVNQALKLPPPPTTTTRFSAPPAVSFGCLTLVGLWPRTGRTHCLQPFPSSDSPPFTPPPALLLTARCSQLRLPNPSELVAPYRQDTPAAQTYGLHR
jgi:hypothetical protein